MTMLSIAERIAVESLVVIVRVVIRLHEIFHPLQQVKTIHEMKPKINFSGETEKAR